MAEKEKMDESEGLGHYEYALLSTYINEQLEQNLQLLLEGRSLGGGGPILRPKANPANDPERYERWRREHRAEIQAAKAMDRQALEAYEARKAEAPPQMQHQPPCTNAPAEEGQGEEASPALEKPPEQESSMPPPASEQGIGGCVPAEQKGEDARADKSGDDVSLALQHECPPPHIVTATENHGEAEEEGEGAERDPQDKDGPAGGLPSPQLDGRLREPDQTQTAPVGVPGASEFQGKKGREKKQAEEQENQASSAKKLPENAGEAAKEGEGKEQKNQRASNAAKGNAGKDVEDGGLPPAEHKGQVPPAEKEGDQDKEKEDHEKEGKAAKEQEGKEQDTVHQGGSADGLQSPGEGGSLGGQDQIGSAAPGPGVVHPQIQGAGEGRGGGSEQVVDAARPPSPKTWGDITDDHIAWSTEQWMKTRLGTETATETANQNTSQEQVLPPSAKSTSQGADANSGGEGGDRQRISSETLAAATLAAAGVEGVAGKRKTSEGPGQELKGENSREKAQEGGKGESNAPRQTPIHYALHPWTVKQQH